MLFAFSGCRSGAASFQEGFLPGFNADAYLLPTDLLFKKELATASYRLPADSSSAVLFNQDAHRYPLVFDGFSPRSHFFVPVPCNLREDLIPDGDSDTLFLYDLAYRKHVPITVRYRNTQNCGLIIRSRHPLEMDRVYALALIQSYIWEDRIEQPDSLGRLFDRLRKVREETPELERMAEPFGLRPRETLSALDLLRAEGIVSSRILRLGIAVIRSRGGLYGPFLGMQRRYQLEEKAQIDSVRNLGQGIYSFNIELRNPCSGSPCLLQPVNGPGLMANQDVGRGSMVDRQLLIRFPEGRPARGIMWMEAADSTPERNRKLMQMAIFKRIADESSLILAMQIVPATHDVNERMALIIEKNAQSRLLRSFTTEELRHCAESKQCDVRRDGQIGRTLLQLCLTDGDCAASAALDSEVGAVILTTGDVGLPGAAFENGKLPTKNQILTGYARDLREDLFSIDLSRKYMQSDNASFIRKKVHVAENFFNEKQYDSMMKFLNNTITDR